MYLKTFLYTIGLLTAMCMTMGMTFLILHLPGGFQLFNYGFLVFALVFVPVIAYNNYRGSADGALYEKLRPVFGLASAVVTGVAVVFKLLHFPFTDFLLLTGAGIFTFAFLPFLFYTMYKRSSS